MEQLSGGGGQAMGRGGEEEIGGGSGGKTQGYYWQGLQEGQRETGDRCEETNSSLHHNLR